ncbi:CDP-alcohol phosphatidyltransferase family protein [Marinomonas rhodophyticola]|uniref:CDP-alcohol phosphatidyltransferase family protein n=1 Tax=Marinomonas rhodophyticola TaxID=2992803 RepID=UPI002AA2AF86|nr:CDP-alcohol phosphatidyltransferase family protein [Marinomonas sp. KJ51-3]
MLDTLFIKTLKHPLRLAAVVIDKLGVKANWITLLGFVIGMMVLPALYFGNTSLALVLVIINRVMDGLDGAVARLQGPTDLGVFRHYLGFHFLFGGGLWLCPNESCR